MTHAFPLPASLDAGEAPRLKELLLEAAPTVIDASSVTRIGCPCVQVLVAYAAHQKAQGRALAVTNAPAIFTDAFQALGFPAWPMN